jgi:hypothetical protein
MVEFEGSTIQQAIARARQLDAAMGDPDNDPATESALAEQFAAAEKIIDSAPAASIADVAARLEWMAHQNEALMVDGADLRKDLDRAVEDLRRLGAS